MANKKTIYKIIFLQLGEIYEIFAKQIYQSDMYGFIEVEEYIFNKNKQLVVDPSNEKLYFCSQRGKSGSASDGVTYEVKGLFIKI